MMADSAAYTYAWAALVGTFVGGITSIATSWPGQQRQTKEQRRARDLPQGRIACAARSRFEHSKRHHGPG
jgi:hypothetical protein